MARFTDDQGRVCISDELARAGDLEDLQRKIDKRNHEHRGGEQAQGAMPASETRRQTYHREGEQEQRHQQYALRDRHRRDVIGDW